MTIDELACKPVHWLRSTGPMSDIVISSRIRLARNVASFPFLSKATERQRTELVESIRGCILGSARGGEWAYLDVDGLDQMDGHILVERHLISRQHLDGRGDRGLALTRDESAAVMINEEDHLRIQVLRSGFQLDEVWEEIDRLDDRLEDKIDFAFHPRYGYLTACPTNVGTGIRVSVMLHLPALKLTNEIEKVLQAARDMRLAVRGLFGEGTEATGDFFQVSNQVTLGRTEQEIIDEFKHVVIPKIVDYEHRARQSLIAERALALDDRVWRSYGILKNARMISSEETMLHLSHIRMGINLGRMKELDLQAVNELFLVTQPAHLQKLHGMRLNGEQRGAARAEIIRRRLSKN
jgi:protein arginine kinase